MNGKRFGRPLYGLGASALLVAGIVSAGNAGAQDDGGSPLIDAEVEATVVITGGEARGGDAVGGDAGLVASITDSSGTVAQQADLLQGGSATGGDARGGDGLNAYIDANVVLDADIALDVAADVDVNTVAGASLDLSDVPINGIGGLSSAQTVPDGLAGSVAGGLNDIQAPELQGGLSNADTGALGGLPSADLGGALGGLAGLNLLDLVAVLDVEVAGGDATGGTAVGGSALLQATIDGSGGGSSKSSGSATIHQVAGDVYGGDATAGQAIGGDGIELDLLLDADIDLVVDADVDLVADVDTFIEGDVGIGAGQGARLARFDSD